MSLVTATDHSLNIILTNVGDVSLEISKIVRETNIYQDIFMPCMTGNVTLDDASGLFDDLPIAGYEKIRFILETIDNGTPLVFDKTFRVFSVEGYEAVKTNHRTYTIKFADEVAYNNRVNTHYNMKKLKTHDAIEPILKRNLYLTEDDYEFKDLEGELQRPMIFGYKNPLDIIKKICNKSIGKGTNATYTFYQTKDKFVLNSIENLVNQEVSRSYYYVPAMADVETRYIKDRVYKFRVDSAFNRLEHESSGARSVTVVTHDIIRKKQSTFKYDYDTKFDEISHMETNKFISNVEEPVSSKNIYNTSANTMGSSIDDLPVNFPQEVIARRLNQLQNLKTVKVVADVPGDLFNEIGNIVEFNLTSYTSNLPELQKHKYLSGKYMITAIHHYIANYQYHQILELTKDSLPDSLEIPQNDNTTVS